MMSTDGPKETKGGPAREIPACGLLVIERDRVIASTPGADGCLYLKAGALANAALDSLPMPLPEWIRAAMADGQPQFDRELLLENGRGATLWRVHALPLAKGGIVVIALHSLAVAQVFDQNLRQLDRLANLGSLSAGLAHEIKNGMVALQTFVQLLLEKERDSELTAVVRRELRRMDTIATQMLRFATPARSAFASVHVHELLDHSLRLLQHQINGRMISLTRRYQAAPDTAPGDEYQLQQAFMNLLFNAVQAMGMDGALTVSTDFVEIKPGERRLRVQIQDTGAGIAPENLTRLFEPFFTTKKSGTGLGLTICQRILHEHHGNINVQSEVNKGSTFSVLLPMA
jgi:signal transduction histidine kinase